MFNRCESCGRDIAKAEDCRLWSHDGISIRTYCAGCYMRKKQG